MGQYQLDYYFFPECPYCDRVLKTIVQLKVPVTFFNINQDANALKKLVTDTGRKTVPCLYINGKPMHESADIIVWLKQNFKE
jgi:glutaredoxin